MIKERCMTFRGITVLVGLASLFAGLVIPVANAQQVSGRVKVVSLQVSLASKTMQKEHCKLRTDSCILSTVRPAQT
jgi:hypothetical protein